MSDVENHNTTTDESSSSFLIQTPNSNDVLFGRGFVCREHPGSKQFRELCRRHRADYVASRTHETKHVVGYAVMNLVQALEPPGRFLELVQNNGGQPVWKELDPETALKKVKQSLRDTKDVAPLEDMLPSTMAAEVAKVNESLRGNTKEPLEDMLPSTMAAEVVVADNAETSSSHDENEEAAEQLFGLLEMEVKQSIREYEDVAPLEDMLPSTMAAEAVVPDNAETSNSHDENEETAEQLFDLLEMDDAPKFTAEDLQREEESRTEEDRRNILKDLLGALFFGTNAPEKKRVKRTAAVPRSVEALLEELRREIESIPKIDKAALLEAQSRVDASEFADERLEQFLRREEMDPRRAAQRFVAYWEQRRKLFGPKKYLMRMTLQGALRDDLPALRGGTFCLLPRDESGRSLIFRDQSRRLPEEHTSESLVRVFWYLLELVTQESTGLASEFVLLTWEKNTTILDYDWKLDHRLIELENRFLPVSIGACHVCCIPQSILFMIRPVEFALMDKRTRERTVIHGERESKLLEALAGFGILNGMLPVEMGGTVVLDHSEWIASRSLVEISDSVHSPALI